MPDVSVIIPIYNVRNFIGRCAESLMKQTLDDVEFIFVDDCTPDDSIEVLYSVLGKYPGRKDAVRVVRHEVNKGLPSARNTGLGLATGEYIFHCDGDDFVEPEMLEEMYRCATVNSLDIVWCDFYENVSNNIDKYISEPDVDSPEMAIKEMMSAGMRFNVWNKLIKTTLYKNHNISFLDGHSMGEDISIIKLFLFANKIGHLNRAFYHYVKYNPNALTKKISEKEFIDVNSNVLSLIGYLDAGRFSEAIDDMKLWQKFPLLLTDGRQGEYEKWREWFPEANVHIWQHKNTNFRIKLIEWFAANKIDLLLKIHFFVIIKFYYSLKG